MHIQYIYMCVCVCFCECLYHILRFCGAMRATSRCRRRQSVPKMILISLNRFLVCGTAAADEMTYTHIFKFQ